MRYVTLLFFVAGCGGGGIQNGDGGANADLAPAPDLLIPGSMPITITIGPIMLGPGEERTVCSTFKLPNTDPIDVVRLDTVLAPGSHHLVFYKSVATQEMKDLYDCPPLNVSGGDIPLYIPETQNNNLLNLPTGVAYHFDAGQMVKMEAHYLNATNQAIMGRGDITLTVGPKTMQYQPADIMFCGSVAPLYPGFGSGVPPGAVDLPVQFWKPPAGISVFGVTTHEHKRGTLMTLDKATGVNDPMATNLTMGAPYDNPPFKVFDDKSLVTFGPNEGFRWQCHYQNDNMTACTKNTDCDPSGQVQCKTGKCTYFFGESAATNEMCFFWAYYFPSVGHFIDGNPMDQKNYMQGCWQ